jgi:pilus assembly protein CpaE
MANESQDNIRVLIVDDFPETRENLRRLLQFESDISVVGEARSGEEAIQLARDSQPEVVLMDINMPDMDGITATEALLRDVPFAQIVILSVQSEADYMRRAMRAGAVDFIAKPPSGDELISTIRQVSVRAKEQRLALAVRSPQSPVQIPGAGVAPSHRPEGKVITFYSAKGGVGCTMLATNVAIGMQSTETQVVLVDTNLQFGDVSVFLNMQVKFSINDLTSRAEELDQEFLEEILMVHESGLHLLAGPPKPEMAEEVRADDVRSVLQFLKKTFAYVIVDTSSTMDDVTLAVLDVTDLLVAVASPDIPSIKDARLLFDLLHVLEFPLEQVCFVINKLDKKGGITAEAVAENLKREVEGVIPLDERSVTASINRGVPILLGEKSSPQAKSILDLIGSIKQRLVVEAAQEGEQQEKERSKLFGR